MIAEDLLELLDKDLLDGELLDPPPETWKEMMKLPTHIKVVWETGFKTELKGLFKAETFAIKEKPANAPVIPVTAKFRCKLKANGMVDKPKVRVCFRGDLQKDHIDGDTFTPIANFRELRRYLATAAAKGVRIYQLDFIGAFLQAYTKQITYTYLPKEWAYLVPEYAEYFGVPLLVVKALYHTSGFWTNDTYLIK